MINLGIMAIRGAMLLGLIILLDRADVTVEEFAVTLGLAGALSLFSYVHGLIKSGLATS